MDTSRIRDSRRRPSQSDAGSHRGGATFVLATFSHGFGRFAGQKKGHLLL